MILIILTINNSDANVISKEHSKRLSLVSYHIFLGIASVPSLSQKSGIKMLPSAFFYYTHINKNEKHDYRKMNDLIASGVRGFRQDPTGLMNKNRINESYGIRDAYELQSPVIDTDKPIGWLMSLVKGKKATLVTRPLIKTFLKLGVLYVNVSEQMPSSMRQVYKATCWLTTIPYIPYAVVFSVWSTTDLTSQRLTRH
jgi:hypothetical protein